MEVNLPSEEVPVELPEPALGINFARDGMNKKDWLSLVAIHCDCWLLSVAFYYAVGLNSVNSVENPNLPKLEFVYRLPRLQLAWAFGFLYGKIQFRNWEIIWTSTRWRL